MQPRPTSAIVRAYQWSRRGQLGMQTLSDAVLAGFWLGLLRSSDLEALAERHYASSAFSLPERNLAGFFNWEEKCLKLFPPGGRILVTAAGGGRELIALRQRGYDADGCECNPVLAAAANALLDVTESPVHVSPPNTFVAPHAPYDAVIVGWASYAHIQGRAQRIDFLQSLAASLRPGAPVMLSFPTRPDSSRALRITRLVANGIRRVSGRNPVELGDNLLQYCIHMFSRRELEEELRTAGYVLELYGETDYGHAVCRRIL